jgi:hypothetical protein
MQPSEAAHLGPERQQRVARAISSAAARLRLLGPRQPAIKLGNAGPLVEERLPVKTAMETAVALHLGVSCNACNRCLWFMGLISVFV